MGFIKVKKLRVPEFGMRWYIVEEDDLGRILAEYVSRRFRTKRQAQAFYDKETTAL